jgi:hypothetical protein
MFPSFPRYKEGTGGRGQIEPGPPVAKQEIKENLPQGSRIVDINQLRKGLESCEFCKEGKLRHM